MSNESDAKVYTADPYDTVALAEEAIEAMRATGPVSHELERTFLAGARRHARFVAERVGEPEAVKDI